MIVSSAKHQRIVDVPKTYLWKRISDFKNIGALLPPPIIDEVKCESNEIGSLRYLTLGEKQKRAIRLLCGMYLVIEMMK